ncbi:MAG: WhiB family transcriptional regulator [Actinomycetota bacterium]
MNPPLIADAATTSEPLLLFDLRRSLWQREARCKGQTDLFFAPDGEAPSERIPREREAIAICKTCPVVDTCRETARENREIGVWGGETDEERAAAGFPPRNLSRRSVIRAARTGRVDRAS